MRNAWGQFAGGDQGGGNEAGASEGRDERDGMAVMVVARCSTTSMDGRALGARTYTKIHSTCFLSSRHFLGVYNTYSAAVLCTVLASPSTFRVRKKKRPTSTMYVHSRVLVMQYCTYCLHMHVHTSKNPSALASPAEYQKKKKGEVDSTYFLCTYYGRFISPGQTVTVRSLSVQHHDELPVSRTTTPH